MIFKLKATSKMKVEVKISKWDYVKLSFYISQEMELRVQRTVHGMGKIIYLIFTQCRVNIQINKAL